MKTFQALKLRYDQNKETMSSTCGPSSGEIWAGIPSGVVSGGTGRRRPLGPGITGSVVENDMDRDEEAYWDNDKDEEWGDDELPTTPTISTRITTSSASPVKKEPLEKTPPLKEEEQEESGTADRPSAPTPSERNKIGADTKPVQLTRSDKHSSPVSLRTAISGPKEDEEQEETELKPRKVAESDESDSVFSPIGPFLPSAGRCRGGSGSKSAENSPTSILSGRRSGSPSSNEPIVIKISTTSLSPKSPAAVVTSTSPDSTEDTAGKNVTPPRSELATPSVARVKTGSSPIILKQLPVGGLVEYEDSDSDSEESGDAKSSSTGKVSSSTGSSKSPTKQNFPAEQPVAPVKTSSGAAEKRMSTEPIPSAEEASSTTEPPMKRSKTSVEQDSNS